MPSVHFEEADVTIKAEEGKDLREIARKKQMKENLKFGAAAAFFTLLTLFFLIFMLFEWAGYPLF